MKDFKTWAKAAGIRALKTAAQTAAAALTGKLVFTDVDWQYVGALALLAGVYSIITSIAGLPEVTTEATTEVTE